jgi:preprotein translocase subunit SecA
MYKKLSGMTGTAATEAQELSEIYKVDTVVVPTNVLVARTDLDDEVYRTAKEKYTAILSLIRECNDRKQPVLVGTISIEKSEYISGLLKKEGIPHNVLNARYHDVEAAIIADAGKPGAVTIATNMAGRGTDIKLGGNLEVRLAKELSGVEDEEQRRQIQEKVENEINEAFEEVKKAGGLYVIGTERHESRRIDNQLRGRSGRQGDPGASKFFLSLEDDLMRIFGAEKLDSMMQKLGLEEGEAITHSWINKVLEKAQKRVESHNYDIRKHLLKFDDVMNDQRKVIYEQRIDLMDENSDFSGEVDDMRVDVIHSIFENCIPPNTPSEFWDYTFINEQLNSFFGSDIFVEKGDNLSKEDVTADIVRRVSEKMRVKEESFSSETMRHMERTVMLRLIDQHWKEHLLNLDRLRQGINLRAYAQRDPLNEYKQEAFALFEKMVATIREETTRALCLYDAPQGLPERNIDDMGEDFDLEKLLEAYGAKDFGELARAFAKERGLVFDEENNVDDDNADGSIIEVETRDSETIAQNNGKEGAEKKDAGGRKSSTTGHHRKAKSTEETIRTAENSENAENSDVFSASRNAPCPCGSGERFKNCHGKVR